MPVNSAVDLNVLLPLVPVQHPHRATAADGWDTCMDTSVVFTLPVRMGMLRLLTNRALMAEGVLSPDAAWQTLDALTQDSRAVIAREVPAGMEALWLRLVRERDPSPNLWTDAWLEAFAEVPGYAMVTFDRGFRTFNLSHLHLLGAA